MDEKWYKEGLRFQCTQCGKCCSGPSGYVWVTFDEIENIASFLKISPKEFHEKYLRQVGSKYSLLEIKNSEYDCIFLKDKQCQIYEVRPTQCKSFPWWSHTLNSPETWAKESKRCEGINENAPLISFDEIQKLFY